MASEAMIDWVVATSILYSLSTIAVLLRVLATRIRGVGWKLPEYLVFFAWVCQSGYLVDVSVAGVSLGGYGYHFADLLPSQIVNSLKAFWISEWLWATAIMSFRLAILLLYMDIFYTNTFRWQAICTASVIFAYWVACVFTICLLCRPVQFNWDLSLNGTCGNVPAIEIFSGVFNMVVDIWVVFLPLPIIWKLQLTPQKKWILTAAFSLGLGTAGVNLGRLIQTLQCPSGTDPTYCALNSSILVFAEMSGGILVATVPTLGPLVAGCWRVKSNTPSSGSKRDFHTIGSIPLRIRKSKGTMLDDSVFSQNDLEAPIEDSTAALVMKAANMGHHTEIGRSQSNDGSTAEHPNRCPPNGNVMRTVEYNVN